MSVTQQHIPVGVARSVLGSSWLMARLTDDPFWESVAGQFKRAESSKYKSTISLGDADLAQKFFDLASGVREEMVDAGVKPVSQIEAMTRFRDEIGDKVKALEDDQRRQEQRAAQQDDQARAESRRWATEQREETLSPMVETHRTRTLKQVAEDYGLDYKDIQVRAALVAAFHGGAIAFHEATTYVRHDLEVKIAPESWTQFLERDRELFRRARDAQS